MSNYTTELRFICETAAGLNESSGFSNVNTVLNAAAPKVFNFDWPVFDENYRLPLEIKILRHYYTREICEETVGLWKLRLQDRLCNIMPYYNELYKSAQLEFNPFYDVDVTRDHNRVNDGSSNTSASGSSTSKQTSESSGESTEKGGREITRHGESEGSGTSETTSSGTNNQTNNGTSSTTGNGTNVTQNTDWDLFNDTPQGGIDGIPDIGSAIGGNNYLTNARKKYGNGNVTTTETGKTTTEGGQYSTSSGNDKTDNSSKETSDETDTENTERQVNESATGEVNGESSTQSTAENIIKSTEDYIEHVKGKQGTKSYSSMLLEYRKTLLNIDQMVLEELSDLFFGLW